MNARTISEAAASTGFTASALRYYEDAGLITPDRTSAGYRVYDERDIERLRFISRAKHLGLSLDEITELVGLWDGDQCAPVASRLRELVDEKIDETQTRVAELIEFASDLRRFRVALSPENATGACGDGCACHGPGSVLEVAPSAEPEASPPIACALDPSGITARMEEWQRVLARAIGAPRAVEGGVTVRFPAERALAQEVASLAAEEQSCCSFFAFALRIDHRGTEMTVTAQADAAPLVEALFGAPA